MKHPDEVKKLAELADKANVALGEAVPPEFIIKLVRDWNRLRGLHVWIGMGKSLEVIRASDKEWSKK